MTLHSVLWHYKLNEDEIMAREIRETPVLIGKDAARFEKKMKENEKRKVSHKEYEQGRAAYKTFGFAK